jgi:CRP-like cAMP-binding protein
MNAPTRGSNRLLSRLPANDYERLLPHFKTLSLNISTVLYEANAPIEFAYFPHNCVLSAIALVSDGEGIEVGTIGNEGMAGLTVFLGPCTSPNRVFIQVAGDCLRIEAEALAVEAKKSPAINDLLLRHHLAFFNQVTQSIACNGLHSLTQRCCRWLLMTHDRVDGDDLPLTHEFLSLMLSVRRPGVTEALQNLQSQGLISAGRGTIKVVNRPGLEAACCECYRVVANEYQRLLGHV